MARDWRKPRTIRSLRSQPPLQTVRQDALTPHTVACARDCGRVAAVIAVDMPDHECMVMFGDRVARIPLCLICLEADDPLSWYDIEPIDPRDDITDPDPAPSPSSGDI